jgi:hypothetical protein
MHSHSETAGTISILMKIENRLTRIEHRLDQIEAIPAAGPGRRIDWAGLVHSLWFKAVILVALLAAQVELKDAILLIAK